LEWSSRRLHSTFRYTALEAGVCVDKDHVLCAVVFAARDAGCDFVAPMM